jgi:hypothetical protein
MTPLEISILHQMEIGKPAEKRRRPCPTPAVQCFFQMGKLEGGKGLFFLQGNGFPFARGQRCPVMERPPALRLQDAGLVVAGGKAALHRQVEPGETVQKSEA